MKKKDFTLIELIEVLILLAVIVVLTTPTIFTWIEKARINAFKSDVESLIQAIDLKKDDSSAFNPVIVTENNISDVLDKPNDHYYNVEVMVDKDASIHILVEGRNKWEGLTACGTSGKVIVGGPEECGLFNVTY
ncbi:MAG: type II secretion system protein [Bacilli bacterium]|nr:type II secretion system protein [Bacilli bacterium]MDD3304622.1 type II secretion system protein [Bacilli bacterium]MDD4053535.1 type II secretion system protein [Bacilli bacterium]MDD4411498.1 type II secretion system protein [Bacilli bacterium]